MSKTLHVAKKEMWSYFSSPTAFIFLGTYLLVSLFTFFWVEKFFSRNIADLRPLFEWMPVLLIFLIATLTMRMWSEERRMGTLEFLLTLPVKTHELVLGKFLACMGLVTVALALTLGLAVSVGLLGHVDWGPVAGAYLASLLLAGAYTAIGLFISSKSESQIISLILTVLACSVFYLLGSETIVHFFGNRGGEILRLIGTGSRFDAISRGIFDFRDIYYYLSLTAVFLALNSYSLERLKWSQEAKKPKHTLMTSVLTLLALNLIAANLWLYKVNSARLDMTADRFYSISDSTKEILGQLEEPLLIRGYFSAQTHPLLAPLVPTIRDFLTEYQLASNGKVRSEFIDPRDDEELEAEVNRRYHIEPVPFQIADRHSASMVSSYFNIVVQYGDEHEILGFEELIEIKQDGVTGIDVKLRNLEYDITRSIKKVMQSFKTTDNAFASLDHPVKFVGYVSAATLPKQLETLYGDLQKTLASYQKEAGGKLEVEFLDPSTDAALAKTIAEQYGFAPQAMSLFARDSFYFYLTLQDGEKVFSLGVPEDLSVTSFKNSLDATLKRMVPGFLRTVGIYTPPAAQVNPMMAQFGQGGGGGKQYQAIRQKLEQNYATQSIDLESGQVPNEVDILLVVAPKELKEKQIFAIDQFLMKGGTVVVASSPVTVEISRQGFNLTKQTSGLEKWLAYQGIEVPEELVLDKQNTGFPEIRRRQVQGVSINEPYIAPYPFFVNVRDKGLNQDNAMTSGLGQLTLAWASPLVVDADKNKERKLIELVKSSPESWRTKELSIDSDRMAYPELGFAEGDKKEPSLLAAAVEGRFTSYFAGKESPLLAADDDAKKAELDDEEHLGQPGKKDDKKQAVVTSVIDKSPEIARLFVFASNEFISDDVLKISSMVSGTQVVNPLQIVENALDWSTEDRALLTIRSRGHFARTLAPLTESQKNFWEILNYVIALVGLLGVFVVYKSIQSKARRHYKELNLV